MTSKPKLFPLCIQPFLVPFPCFSWLLLPVTSLSIQQTSSQQIDLAQCRGVLRVPWQPPGLEVLSLPVSSQSALCRPRLASLHTAWHALGNTFAKRGTFLHTSVFINQMCMCSFLNQSQLSRLGSKNTFKVSKKDYKNVNLTLIGYTGPQKKVNGK